MRVGDRFADIDKERDDRCWRQPVLRAPDIDAHAFDQRHRQPWRAIISNPRFKQAGDMRMTHAGQHCLLLPEQRIAAAGLRAQRKNLYGRRLGRAVDRMRPIHHGHTATADFVLKAPAPEFLAAECTWTGCPEIFKNRSIEDAACLMRG